MRPLSLAMTAFGPFPATETIDFTRLGENPLFLINGPTGAGKTTILDAICFALYGKTTDDKREGAQMRCDLAAAETLCEVTLTFELGGRAFRIRRVPEQPRPKARGEGTTTQAPEAQFHELLTDGSERLIVASKVSEATLAVEKLTGLSVDQFRQVMVLPQGKFRQLLLAESYEREKIFSDLFQTGIYKRLEESLKARAATIRQERERQLQLQQGMLEGADLESVEALDAELAERTPACATAVSEKEAMEQSLSAAEKALLQGQNLAQEFLRLDRASAELNRLEGERSTIDAVRQRIAHAEQAGKLTPLLGDRDRCAHEEELARQEAEAAAVRLQDAEQALATATSDREDVAGLREEQRSVTGELTRLKGYGERFGSLAAARATLKEAETAAAEAGLILRFKQLADRYLVIHNREAKEREIGRQRTTLEQLQQLEELRRREQKEWEEAGKRLELAWHQGQAAILAAELQAGKPCPVCGSSNHPAPAHTDAELPDQQQVEAAREEVRTATATLDVAKLATAAAQERLRDLEREAKSLTATIIGDTTLDALKVEITDIQAEAKRLGFTLPDREQIQQLDAEILRATQEATRSAVAAAQALVAGAEQELPEAYREPEALQLAVKNAEGEGQRIDSEINRREEGFQQANNARTAALTAAKAAAAQHGKTGAAFTEALAHAATAIVDSPFADEAAWRSALIDDATLSQLKMQVSQFDTAFAEQSGIKKELGGQLAATDRPDLEHLQARRTAAEEARNLARDAWAAIDKRLSTLSVTKTKLERAAADCAELDRQYAVIGTLSDVANGQTGNKISLQRFVLSVLLDDVLVEASHRLSLMSKGQYRLLRKEDRTKGNKASGLELEVEDAHTGRVRSVATLSGGESFMAALALALGLSDVVQAYAGGIRLDALFVDEGFGSLDSESLDLAIRTLIDLQATGRMVGIISHVAELKEQIPLRLDVLAERSGSRVVLVNPYQ